MRLYLFLLFLLAGSVNGMGQSISYTLPIGMEQAISAKDYKRLVDASVSGIAHRYQVDSVVAGTVLLKQGQGMQAFHLHNLIGKYAAAAGKKQRRKVVRDHFEQLFAAIDAQNRIDPDHFDSVRSLLTTHMYPAAFIQQQTGTDSLVKRTDAAATQTVLMLELPGGQTVPVQQSLLRRWGKTEAEAFAVAEQNVIEQQLAWMHQSGTAPAITSDTAQLNQEVIAAQYGLDLDQHSPELLGEMGSVLAVAATGAIGVYKIDRNKPVDIPAFIHRTRSVTAPDAMYFWYYKGRFTPLDVRTDETGAITVTTPNELMQLLSEL